jgi:hypothetical protein
MRLTFVDFDSEYVNSELFSTANRKVHSGWTEVYFCCLYS